MDNGIHLGVKDLEMRIMRNLVRITARNLVSAWSLQIPGSLLRVCERKSFLSFRLICSLRICILMHNLLGKKVSF